MIIRGSLRLYWIEFIIKYKEDILEYLILTDIIRLSESEAVELFKISRNLNIIKYITSNYVIQEPFYVYMSMYNNFRDINILDYLIHHKYTKLTGRGGKTKKGEVKIKELYNIPTKMVENLFYTNYIRRHNKLTLETFKLFYDYIGYNLLNTVITNNIRWKPDVLEFVKNKLGHL